MIFTRISLISCIATFAIPALYYFRNRNILHSRVNYTDVRSYDNENDKIEQVE
jgi:hypothetical protein